MGGIARVAAVAAACLLAGCGTKATNVEIGDLVFLPDLRLGGSFDGAEGLQRGGGFELYATRASGSDTQRQTPGEPPVRYMDQVFDPPGEPHLQHEFRFNFLSASYRYRERMPQSALTPVPLWVEVLAGVARAEVDLRVTSVLREVSGLVDSSGVVVGGGLIFDLAPATRVQARGSVFIGSPGERDIQHALRLELFLAQALGKHLSVRAGYAGWRLTSAASNASKIHLDLHGPALGLELNF
jgi:hypothetical protein